MYEITYFSFDWFCDTLLANANENHSHFAAPIFGRFPSYDLLLHLRVALSRTE